MKKTLPLTIWFLTTTAHAQEQSEPTAEQLQTQITALEAELAALNAVVTQGSEARADLEALLDAAATLSDRSLTDEAKIAAVGVMAQIRDPRAVPFIKLAADRESVAVKRALLEAAPVFSEDPRIHNMVRWLAGPSQPESVRTVALAALDAAAVPDAPQILMDIAGSYSESETLRSAARQQLETNHAEYLQAQGGIQQAQAPRDRSAGLMFSATNAAAGSLLLATVGELGQSGSGTAIGAFGGALIGGGISQVYLSSNPVTIEDALQYTNMTGWGAVYGLQTAYIANADTPLYALTGGTTVGALSGLAAMSRRDPSREDIAELSGAMVLGNQVFTGAGRWGDVSDEGRVGLGMLGQTLGGGAGLLLRDAVSLDDDDAILITSAGVVGGWAGLVGPLALGAEQNIGGVMQTLIPLSMVAAVGLSEVSPVPRSQTLTADYGFISGNLLGAGVSELVDPETDEVLVAQGMLTGGVVGGVVGAMVHDRLSFDAGDRTLIPVSTVLATAEASALSYVLYEKADFYHGNGLILTTAGAAAALSGLASQVITVEPAAPLLVGSAAGWGVFYGGLFPVALGVEGEPADLVLAVTLTSDLLMLAAGASQHPEIALDPRATVLPQLGGVGGSVLGALGVALFTTEPQGISAGTLLGSGVGAAVGVGLERRYGSEWLPRAEALPAVRLVSAPAVIDAEETGMVLGVAIEGW